VLLAESRPVRTVAELLGDAAASPETTGSSPVGYRGVVSAIGAITGALREVKP
jgi:hypothetical protein